MSYFSKRLQIIKNDSYLVLTLHISLICICLHLYQFIDSEYQIEPLIRLIFSCGFPFVIFFSGRIGTYWYWWSYSNFLALQTTFQNYTAFIIVVIFGMLIPKMKKASLVVYALEIVAVATMRNKTPVHFCIHLNNCICIYYALNYLLKPTVSKRGLDLTHDEILILDELLKGKQQKEITFFSENTVSAKLKKARERNDIGSTDELLIRYREEIKK